MAPRPIGSNAQKQRLTTALKNICRDYPAGGTVIRELLQNADDAGATEARFVLDDKTHPTENLISPSLAQYQGPSILSFNNAVFLDKDFESLSRLGDSLKLTDGATTGRFGRGFNSVYNWTDSPSIVSRDRLLILDPHQEWSEGGPVYNFVEDAMDPEIQNQMETYKAVLPCVDKPLNGTVIRIPLRNKNQTLKSEIDSRSTTISEIQDVLKIFAAEFGTNGLLFMRNVTKLEVSSPDMSLKIEMVDGQSMQHHKSKINDAVKAALKTSDFSFHYNFQAGIQYTSNGQSSTTNFMIQHSIQGDSMDAGLRSWANDQKLIPWVAVAAQLSAPSEKSLCSLFTVLPLPVHTLQPVHMHALFSLSPDRARLHQSNDKSTQDRDPAKWNDWLFKDGVPVAWAKLLCGLAELYPFQSMFEKWPQLMENNQDPLSNAVGKVVGIIDRDSLKLWPTVTGYVNAQDGLLATGAESAVFRDSLREAQVPVVFVPKDLLSYVRPVFKTRTLCPENVCAFLESKQSSIAQLSGKTKRKLLEYILTNPGSSNYGDLEIFPFEDKAFRSLRGISAFVHRNDLEQALFNKQPDRNLDLETLSAPAQRILKQGCESAALHPSIRFRSVEDLGEYCTRSVFKMLCQKQQMHLSDSSLSEFVAKVWTWVSERGIGIENAHLSSLWLLPLSNGHHRQLTPRDVSVAIYLAPLGLAGDVMRRIDAQLSTKTLPLLYTGKEALGRRPSTILKILLGAKRSLGIVDASNLKSFLQWLRKMIPLVSGMEDEDRNAIAKSIALQLNNPLLPQERSVAIDCVRDLQVFQKLTWEVEGNAMISCLSWTSLRASETSIGLLDDTTRVPDIRGVQFIVATISSPQQQILEAWNLAPSLQSVDMIQDYIIPAWKSGMSDNWSTICKEQTAAYILGAFSSLSLSVQANLQFVPIVPIMDLNGHQSSKFACASELIDPSVAELTNLCFDDEEIVPKGSFFRDFHVALKGCGVKTSIDESVVQHRVKCYASGRYPPAEVQSRARILLQSSCRWTSSLEEQAGSEIRCLAWLPTVKDGVRSLKNSSQCRGIKDRRLVSSRLPLLETPISEAWESRLGWHSIIPAPILFSQLQHGISQKSREIVDAVLCYISANSLVEALATELMTLQFIFIRSDFFVEPSQAFRPAKLAFQGCYGLQPYLANVDYKFWRDHEKLLIQLGVSDKPQPSDLLKLQDILEAKGKLDDHDTGVAIEILKMAASFPRDSLLGLKVLGASGTFYHVGEIYYNDLGALRSKQDVNLTHPDIPLSTIKNLKIDSLSAQRVKGILEIEDDEDEFDQQENTINRISDTLERYPIETTFREYLANADDTEGASKISWVLDNKSHSCRELITPEMQVLQGPSLLSHNDGVFSAHDFDGFRNVGEGSKMQNKESIGQFGRGSQTMFHFTDFPMILSGDYLLILDPQQEVLPMNPMKGRRKPGVKLKLSKIREACPDQLAPFQGHFGYDLDLDHFPGTIFRFPLVGPTSKGLLRTSKRELNSNEICRLMNTYFDEARTSLLFLRRIKTIEFSIHEKPDSGWRIDSNEPLRRVQGSDSRFSQRFDCAFTKHKEFGNTPTTGQDSWQISIQDQSSEVQLLPTTSKRAAKNVECGMAGLISSHVTNDIAGYPSTTIEARMYNTLPLSIASDLPVHVHATFSLSGDRKSIALDEYGSKSPGSESNRYLLQDALPKLYLGFLNDLAEWYHQDSFKFWPQEEPPKRSFGSHIFEAFWKELPKSSLKVLPAQSRYADTGIRKVLCMATASFDFMLKHQSDTLQPLLLSLGVDLVSNVPKPVIKLLKQIPTADIITGAKLRVLLKSDAGGLQLLKAMNLKSEVWDVVFDLIAPQSLSKEDSRELDGCHILPLAEKRLGMGTLRLLEEGQPATYYVVSAEEANMFNFASAKLVLARVNSHIETLLEKAKFNVESLQLCHVEELLKSKPSISVPSPIDDQWLTKFWKYWNRSRGPAFRHPEVENLDAKLFRATCDGLELYITPRAFDQFPAVVQPSTPEHQRLCQRIPGLYLINPDLIPKSLLKEEKNFDSDVSFSRFIRATAALGKRMGVGQFVNRYLDPASTQVLRDIVVDHVRALILSTDRSGGLGTHLKELLLWPSFVTVPRTPLISASAAFIAADSAFLMPWMQFNCRFIDPQFVDGYNYPRITSALAKLQVQQLPPDILLREYILPLPSNVGHIYWQQYMTLIVAITKVQQSNYQVAQALVNQRCALDGNLSLKKASELFDHQNQMFLSAFMLECRTRFVHSGLRSQRALWLKCGLRHEVQDLVDPAQYLECLQVMASRVSMSRAQDPTFDSDMKIVLEPLTTINQRLGRFSRVDWQSISHQQVFQSRSNFNGESEYQRDAMAVIAQGKPIQRLSEIISQEYISVCWSQVPFALHEPTQQAFSQIPGNGRPDVAVVWRHLQNLKAKSLRLKLLQVRDFLADLQKTYQYLQDRLDESMATFDLTDNVVWLNMSEWNHHTVLVEDVQTSWESLDMLVLSSSVDSGSVKAVRPGLMVYEKLLRGLGCKSIAYPTISLPPLPEGYSVGASLRQLRRDGKMLDITYSSEGREVKAHKVVLASVSDYCKSHFSGGWSIPPTIDFDKNADPDAFLSYHTLETMINYAYEEPIDWKEMEVLDADDETQKGLKLDMLLNLCKGADYWLIPSLVSQAEARLLAAGRRFIDLDNVADVRDLALVSGAKHFHKLCEEFIKQNRDAFERAHSEE
ncbi:hypothetical protein IFR05_005183 [Cadophora sp. M221]|nr:hypothetical protein IFR05_005183 [Cadophora sp. M221]